MGLVSGLIFFPRVSFGKWDQRKKVLMAILAIPVYLGLFAFFFFKLYVLGVDDDCNWCPYVNCLPIEAFDAWCY